VIVDLNRAIRVSSFWVVFVADHIDHSGPHDRSRAKDGLWDCRLKQQDQVRRDHLFQRFRHGVPLGVAGQSDPDEQFIGVIIQDDLEVVADGGQVFQKCSVCVGQLVQVRDQDSFASGFDGVFCGRHKAQNRFPAPTAIFGQAHQEEVVWRALDVLDGLCELRLFCGCELADSISS